MPSLSQEARPKLSTNNETINHDSFSKFHKVSAVSRETIGFGISKELPNEKELDKKKEIQGFLRPFQVGVIDTRRPAFVDSIKTLDQKEHLIITSFDPFKNYHAVKMVPEISKVFDTQKDKQIEVKNLTRDIRWPNDVTVVPKEMFGKEGVLVASGFMLPKNNTGEVSFIDIETGTKEKLTQDKKGWFYHKAIPFDLKNDGNVGVLTARSNKSMTSFGASAGELVWLEKPEKKGEPWKEHLLMNGPDVHFDMTDLDGDGKKEIVAGEFFNDRLSYIWQEDGKFNRRVFDKGLKNPFDVEFVDINNDGKKEILVTNHTTKGSVFVYEIPEDPKKGDFVKHEIASNLKTYNLLPVNHAPGKALSFYPKQGMGGKPFILVAGDGSGKLHLLTPKEPKNPKNWDYNETILLTEKCTVGKIKIDVDNQGYAKIYVPLYEKDKIMVYSYNDKYKGNKH